MAEFPRFTVPLIMRCHQSLGARPRVFCGEPAQWFRRAILNFPDGFFCDAHKVTTDTRIPDSLDYRRVRVMGDLMIAGVSRLPREAELEGVKRLLEAVARAGGLLNVYRVTSHIGRYGLPPVLAGAKGPGEGR